MRVQGHADLRLGRPQRKALAPVHLREERVRHVVVRVHRRASRTRPEDGILGQVLVQLGGGREELPRSSIGLQRGEGGVVQL